MNDTPNQKPDEIEKPITLSNKGLELKPETPKGWKAKIHWLFATRKRKIISSLILLIIIDIIVVIAVPALRYPVVGMLLKKDAAVKIIDSSTKKPVSGAEVIVAGQKMQTNADGVAVFKQLPVGEYKVAFSKKHYKSLSDVTFVPILNSAQEKTLQVVATGRTIAVKVTDKITGDIIAGAKVVFDNTITLTNDKGIASVVLAPKSETQPGVVSKVGYNDAKTEIVVRNQDGQTVEISLSPSGKLFFLSKRTGKISVVKANLDGSDQEEIIPGTGREDDRQTILLAARDWRYLALYAKRDSEQPKLYLIDTTTNSMTVIDEGNVAIDLIGWSGHRFVYQVKQLDKKDWESKAIAIKSFNADNNERKVFDETDALGNTQLSYAAQYFSGVYILDNTLVYAKYWYANSYPDMTGKRQSITSVQTDGSNRKSVKDVDYATYTGGVAARAYAPNEVYFQFADKDGKSTYFEYEDNKVTQVTDLTDDQFYNKVYPTYLVSPDGKRTFWYESRDGKSALFVGDNNGSNGKIMGVVDYKPYGWFSDKYLLVSKNDSELYILPLDNQLNNDSKPVKVSDYHKPDRSFAGYGYGYGGL